MTTNMRATAPCLLALCAVAHAAHAQSLAGVSLTPPDQARWEVAAGIGDRNDLDDITYSVRDWWDNFPSFAGGAGYYWTPHLKTEFDLAVTSTRRREVFEYLQHYRPNVQPTIIRSGEQHDRVTSMSGSVLYQFGENGWVHPFAGAGVERARASTRRELQQQTVTLCPNGAPCPSTMLPVQTEIVYGTRPYLTGGFKFYIAPHAFVRTDVRAMLSAERAESVLWRVGLGVDF